MDTKSIILLVVLMIFILVAIVFITFTTMLIIKNKKNKTQQSKSQDIIINSNQTKLQYKKYYDSVKSEFLEDLNNFKANIVIEALENVNYNNLDFKTFNAVDCDNEEIKKKIIGKSGRNKRIIENTIGVDINVIPNEPIKVSSLNAYRREIGIRVMQILVKSDYIDKPKIISAYNKTIKNLESEIYEIGKQTILEILDYKNINTELYSYVGKMKYRFSYNQNILMHSIESAQIASSIANKIGLDPVLASQCAFFHDIGKVIDDNPQHKNHVELGVELATKYKLNPTVILAIKTHHDDIIVDNLYCALVKIVDRLSATRDSVRNKTEQEFINRATEYETICKTFDYVSEAFVLKSGHELRVIIKPNFNNDLSLELMIQEIKDRIINSKYYSSNLSLKIILTKEISVETNI